MVPVVSHDAYGSCGAVPGSLTSEISIYGSNFHFFVRSWCRSHGAQAPAPGGRARHRAPPCARASGRPEDGFERLSRPRMHADRTPRARFRVPRLFRSHPARPRGPWRPARPLCWASGCMQPRHRACALPGGRGVAFSASGARAHTPGTSHKQRIEPPAKAQGTHSGPVSTVPAAARLWRGGARMHALRHRAFAAPAGRGVLSSGSGGRAHALGSSHEQDIELPANAQGTRPGPVLTLQRKGHTGGSAGETH